MWIGQAMLRVSAALLAVLLVLSGPLPARVLAQGGASWECVTVSEGDALNVRAGAGLVFAVIATRQPGETLEADPTQQQRGDGYVWVAVRLQDGRLGWAIASRLIPCDAAQPIGTPIPPTPMPVAGPAGASSVLAQVNADGTLDRFEIAAIGRCVVLLANINRGRIEATGTGTIITPDGLILTNAHVVDEADGVAVGVLEDVNDPPEYRYLGEIVRLDPSVDVALIAIRSDINGRPLDTARLNLPYIPIDTVPEAVYRGDPVTVFGYPGIGNDFLVVTTGSIVSVENGTLFGQRMPAWYRTDAEIAPGSSGGLVVNGDGAFVGIPTMVDLEDVTGGRLGGIRPAQVALLAVMDSLPGTPIAPLALPDALPVAVTLEALLPQHDAVRSGQEGIAFRAAFTLEGWRARPARLVARVYYDDLAGARLINPAAPPQYRDSTGAVQAMASILPCCAQTVYRDEAAPEVFLPYAALVLSTAGTVALKVELALEADDGSWRYPLSWEFITVTVE